MEIIHPQSRQPIPDQAACAFRGILFDVYQWKQTMCDGTEKVFEKLKRPDTVVVFLVLADGSILLAQQTQPGFTSYKYTGFGGRVEEGEDIEQAAKRELLEETGYEVSELVFWKSFQPTTKIDWSVYYFIAKGCTRVSGQSLDGGEKIEPIAMSFDDFLQMARNPLFTEKEIISELYEALLDEDKYIELKKLFSV